MQMAMMDNRPDQSGDEEGKPQGGELGADSNATKSDMIVPGSVSETQLRYIACKVRMTFHLLSLVIISDSDAIIPRIETIEASYRTGRL